MRHLSRQAYSEAQNMKHDITTNIIKYSCMEKQSEGNSEFFLNCICKLAMTFYVIDEIQPKRKLWNIVQCLFNIETQAGDHSDGIYSTCSMTL